MSPRLASRADAASTPFDRADLLRDAAVYVTRFEQTFSSVIWHERYDQVSRLRRKFSSSGSSFSSVSARRALVSELFLVWLPRDTNWIAVRDVIAVDGKPRPARDRRLQTLLSGTTISSDQLRQLASENGRFNIGQIVHTFNEPTLALLFLDEHYRSRFDFVVGGEQRIQGRRAVAYQFVERGRPTVIQDRDRDVPARGTLWIEAATGRVLQTALELSDPAGSLRGQMTVQYGPHPKIRRARAARDARNLYFLLR